MRVSEALMAGKEKKAITIHEFGDKSNPVLMLFPGTMCYWKGNFGHVIDALSQRFLVAAVAYTGFDENDSEGYTSMTDELEKIEAYIWLHGIACTCATASSAAPIWIRQGVSRRVCCPH